MEEGSSRTQYAQQISINGQKGGLAETSLFRRTRRDFHPCAAREGGSQKGGEATKKKGGTLLQASSGTGGGETAKTPYGKNPRGEAETLD